MKKILTVLLVAVLSCSSVIVAFLIHQTVSMIGQPQNLSSRMTTLIFIIIVTAHAIF